MRLIEGLGYLSEDRKGDGLTLNQSIADNVTVTKFDSCSRWGWLDLGTQRNQTEKLVNALKIRTQGVQQDVGSLSGGNQQKVILARELSRNPRTILAAEPTRGLDLESTAFVHEQLRHAADGGASIVLITSDLDEAFALADEIHVIYRGKLSERMKPEVARERIGALMAGLG